MTVTPQSNGVPSQAARTRMIMLVTLAATVLLAVGLLAPAIRMKNTMGSLGDLMVAFDPDLAQRATVLSIVGSIAQLLREKDYFMGTVILVFSVLFPIAKLVAIAAAIWRAGGAGETHGRLLWVKRLGKYSMLDVMVLALIVITLKQFPAVRVELSYGVYCFTGSVLLSMILPGWIAKVVADHAGMPGL